MTSKICELSGVSPQRSNSTFPLATGFRIATEEVVQAGGWLILDWKVKVAVMFDSLICRIGTVMYKQRRRASEFRRSHLDGKTRKSPLSIRVSPKMPRSVLGGK